MAEYHKDQLPEDGIHVAIRWRVPTQVERDALVLTDADVGGLLVQDDVMSLFVLLSAAPVTWSQVPDGDSTLAAILAVNAEVLERVEGPATANDNAIALFDGSTGKLIKESLASIDNLGNITTGGTVDGVDISNLAMALANVAVPSYVTLAATPTLGNERVLTGGTGITVTDGGAGGAVTIASTVAGGAPTDAEYLVAATHAGLSAERVLTAGTGVTLTPAAGLLTVETPNAVQGPASAVDNAVTRWDGTTGKLVQSSVATLDDAGLLTTAAVSLSGNLAVAGTVDGVDVGSLGAVPFVTIGASATVANERALTAGAGISITDGGAGGAVTVSSTVAAGAPTDAEYLVSAASGGLSAERVLTAGANITLTPGAGTLTVASTAGGGGAPTTAQYLTLAADGALTNERVLTAGAGVQFADGGAGGTLVVSSQRAFNSLAGSYTLVLTDAWKAVGLLSGSDVTLTIPDNASVPFPVGTSITVFQQGVGKVTITPAGGVTVQTTAGKTLVTSGIYAVATLTQLVANVWNVTGELEATASYLTLGASAQLANERVLTAGAGVQFSDAGAGGALTLTSNIPAIAQGGTAYTLALSDAGKVIQTSNAATVTITIPTFASVPFAIGNVVKIWQAAAGQVVLSFPGVTVTVPAGKSAASVGLFGVITLVNIAANVWYATGDLAPVLALNNQTGTAYTLALTDGDKCVTMNNAAANTLTIPANASVAFPVGTVITVMQLGVGQTTIAITTDTLLNPALTAKLRARYSVASITKITATSWVLSGDLAAS